MQILAKIKALVEGKEKQVVNKPHKDPGVPVLIGRRWMEEVQAQKKGVKEV